MKILIIEDAMIRQNFFRKILKGWSIDFARDADSGLNKLRNQIFDIVFLDHDLVGAKSGSYLTELWYKQRNDFNTIKPIVIIHSMNMLGATKMENYLKGVSKRTERIPFKLIVTKEVDIKAKILELVE